MKRYANTVALVAYHTELQSKIKLLVDQDGFSQASIHYIHALKPVLSSDCNYGDETMMQVLLRSFNGAGLVLPEIL